MLIQRLTMRISLRLTPLLGTYQRRSPFRQQVLIQWRLELTYPNTELLSLRIGIQKSLPKYWQIDSQSDQSLQEQLSELLVKVEHDQQYFRWGEGTRQTGGFN